jgi:hypothetical protein
VALESRKFFLDVQARQFVVSPDSTLPSFDPVLFEEDVEGIQIFALKPTSSPAIPYEYIDLSGTTLKFAVGVTAPAAIQTTWTAIPTAVTATVSTLVEGATGTAEQQQIAFSGVTPAQGGFAIQFPSRAISVSAVSAGVFSSIAHGLCDNQIVTLTGFTISAFSFANATYFVTQSTTSTFSISPVFNGAAITGALATTGGTVIIDPITTGQIAYNAEPSSVEAAINAAGISVGGISPISVTGVARTRFILVYGGRMSGRNYDPVSIVGSTLAGATGLQGNLSLNTVEIAALLTAGITNVSVEVEIVEGAIRQTFRRPATLSSDIISSTSPLPAPTGFSTGFTLQSGDGTLWAISMSNDGNLEWTALP